MRAGRPGAEAILRISMQFYPCNPEGRQGRGSRLRKPYPEKLSQTCRGWAARWADGDEAGNSAATAVVVAVCKFCSQGRAHAVTEQHDVLILLAGVLVDDVLQ